MEASSSTTAPPAGSGSGSEGSPRGGTCPFSTSAIPAAAVAGCPAFEAGCPFKAAATTEELAAALGKVPSSHAEPGTPAQVALARLLGATHKALPRDGACPFKHIEPLRASAEREWRGWWSGVVPEENDDDEEDAPQQPEQQTPPFPKSSTAYKKKKDEGSAEDEPQALSAMLKAGTERVHAEAENVRFVRALLERVAPVTAYARMLARLARVYEALERAMDDAEARGGDEKGRGRFFADALRRTPSLASDLAYFRRVLLKNNSDAKEAAFEDDHWAASAATDAYVARIERLRAERADHLLAAHLYTRYLGDLSGGQVLKRAVKRGLLGRAGGDDDAEGLRFYAFDAIGGPVEVKKFKEKYRRALDAMADGLSEDERLGVVDEAVAAFRFNTALLAELDAYLPPAPQQHPQSTTGVVAMGPTTAEIISDSSARTRPLPVTGAHGEDNVDAGKKAVCPFLQMRRDDDAAAAAAAPIPAAGRSACPFLAGKPTDETATAPAFAKSAAVFSGPDAMKPASACPFAHFGKRDVAVVAALAVVFIVLPQYLVA